MTWFKVDDKFPTHRKVLSIPRGARRLAAVGAWTLSGAWVAGNSNDGHLPRYVLDDLGIPSKVACDLVSAGLWEDEGDHFLVHDYLQYNPSAEQVRADREAAAERQRRARDKARESRRDGGVTHAEVTPPVTDPRHGPPDPTRPDPKEQTPSVSGPRKRGTNAPDLFPITPELAAWGRVNAPLISDGRAETARFLDYHRAKGTLARDWTAAWRNWMRKANEFAKAEQRPAALDQGNPATAWAREQG